MTTTAERQPNLHQVAESATCGPPIGCKVLTLQPVADFRPMLDIIDMCCVRQRRRSNADRWPKIVDDTTKNALAFFSTIRVRH